MSFFFNSQSLQINTKSEEIKKKEKDLEDNIIFMVKCSSKLDNERYNINNIKYINMKYELIEDLFLSSINLIHPSFYNNFMDMYIKFKNFI
jgi:hypothetical protein